MIDYRELEEISPIPSTLRLCYSDMTPVFLNWKRPINQLHDAKSVIPGGEFCQNPGPRVLPEPFDKDSQDRKGRRLYQ